MMKTLTLFTVLTLILANSASAQFTIIPGLNTTGVDGGGSLLASGAVDSDWVLTSAPAGVGPTTYAGDPIPPNWIPNTPTSRWITPDPVGNVSLAAGVYDYTYTFDLTGLDETTAALDGIWASDNLSTILINGSSTGITHSGGALSFLNWDSFAIDSSNATFNPGLNTMTFRVTNSGGPTGLHVGELNGRAVKAVPEPAAAAVLGGLTLFGFATRRRRAAGRRLDNR